MPLTSELSQSNTNRTSKKIRNIIASPLLQIKKVRLCSVPSFLVFASGNVFQGHTVSVTSIRVTPQVVSLTSNLQQSHKALGPWGSILFIHVCSNGYRGLPRSKSCTATTSVGLQHSYELGTVMQILVLIYTSCLTLETLERLSSFFKGYISSTCQHQDLNLCWVWLRNPSFVP